jgi:putative hemolysin
VELETALNLIALVVCLMITGVSSALETAVAELDPVSHSHSAVVSSPTFQETPGLTIRQLGSGRSAVLALHTGSLVVAAAAAILLGVRLSVDWGVAVLLFALVVFALAYFELTPRVIASSYPQQVFGSLCPFMSVLGKLMAPVTGLAEFMSRPSHGIRLRGIGSAHAIIYSDDFGTIGPSGSEYQTIPPDKADMIRSIFKFGDTVAREVMIPRIDVSAVDKDAQIGEVADIILAAGHTRIPVYCQNIDDIIGVVHAKDVLRGLHNPRPAITLQDIVRSVTFVPDT